ncbi:DNase I-like protein [Piromyces finnis]|uniref:DNase I-like protein n=1 Tax=Piromyces finnis TaxID=1754191 RepID=A0A1Y1V4G9_9FUNG|nr:DNase I-like protein [Piromyces finnis]|eukprot:ORX46197.1 DNase I-like protein [Piromyces finnis]
MATTTENSLDSLRVLCGTWNVGGFQPKQMVESKDKLDLSGWIKVPEVDFIPEIVVLGYQELMKPTQSVQKPRTISQMDNSNKFIDTILYENWIPHIHDSLQKIFPNETYTIEVVHRYYGLGIIVLKRSHNNTSTEVLHSSSSSEGTTNVNSLHYDIKSISIGSVGTGLLGFIGNKGAVSVGLELDVGLSEPLKPCFIATHLHAFPGFNNFVERNEQVNYILDTLVLTKIEKVEADKAINVNDGKEDWKWVFSRQLSKDLYSKVQDYDFTVIMGDMNYRLLQKKGEKHHTQVTSFVEQNKYDDLLVYDELRHIRSQKTFREVKKNPEVNTAQTSEIRNRNINDQNTQLESTHHHSELLFSEQFKTEDYKKSWELINALMNNNPKKLYNPFLGFSEAKIGFPPTYKYKTTSKAPFIDYDYKTYGKPVFSGKRIPAYTDRILFRVQHKKLDFDNVEYWQSYNKSVINVKRYGTDRRLMLSDHKPVSVSLDINWKLLRKFNDQFPKVETSKGKIIELLEDESEVLSKDGDDETQALIPTDNSDYTINPLSISALKAQRIIVKSKALIINVVVCTCLLCYLYLFKY